MAHILVILKALLKHLYKIPFTSRPVDGTRAKQEKDG